MLLNRNRRAAAVLVALITGGSLTGVLAATGLQEVGHEIHEQGNASEPVANATRGKQMNRHTHHQAKATTGSHEQTTASGTQEVEPGGLSISAKGFTLAPEHRTLNKGSQQTLAFRILGADGQAITQFTEQHEHELHLIVVRRDLAHFQHLHPHMQKDGTWTAEVALPVAGAYRAFADFQTGDGQAVVLGTDLFVGGEFLPQSLPEPASRVATKSGYEVTLETSTSVRPGEPTQLRFRITKPSGAVTFTPVMGARGHLIALREGDLAFIHAHPVEESAETASAGAIDFHLVAPSAGRYRLFLQFADAGRLQTVAMTFEVPAIM